MSEHKFDAIDRAILTFIQSHGRAAYADIGAHAGLSVSAWNLRPSASRGWPMSPC